MTDSPTKKEVVDEGSNQTIDLLLFDMFFHRNSRSFIITFQVCLTNSYSLLLARTSFDEEAFGFWPSLLSTVCLRRSSIRLSVLRLYADY